VTTSYPWRPIVFTVDADPVGKGLVSVLLRADGVIE
jgi:hypothetical protein